MTTMSRLPAWLVRSLCATGICSPHVFLLYTEDIVGNECEKSIHMKEGRTAIIMVRFEKLVYLDRDIPEKTGRRL